MLKKTLLTAAGLVVLLGALAGIKALQITTLIAQNSHYAPAPEPVTTASVSNESWEPVLDSVGSLAAVQGVTVTAQLDGNVTRISFEPGSSVRAGDLLVQQDVSTEEAQLRSAEAAAELARINLERTRELLAKATVSQSQFDQDSAAHKQALAQADTIRAAIAKKTIRAPFSGRLGIRLVNLGQTLRAGDPIVSLQALDPIYADFYLPQQDLRLIAPGRTVRLTSDAFPDRVVTGRITAISPDVDSATRNVRVEATVANSDEALHPGMFVQVEVILPEAKKVLVIPATSILYAPYGDSVFVVTEHKAAGSDKVQHVLEQRFVQLGMSRGDLVAVTSGLKAGEVVVSSGAFKLRKGMAVTVDNALAPDAQVAPKPSDS